MALSPADPRLAGPAAAVAAAVARLRVLRGMLTDRRAAVELAIDRHPVAPLVAAALANFDEVLTAAEMAAVEIDEGLDAIAALAAAPPSAAAASVEPA